MKKSLRSRIRKIQRSRILVIIGVVAVAVGIILLIDRGLVDHRIPSGGPAGVQGAQMEELLIKGCLFDLGIFSDEIDISGKAITVRVKNDLARSRVLEAFSPLEGIAGVEAADALHARIIFQDNTWDIFFSLAKKTAARIAIIVDDMGMSLNAAKELASLDADLTFSVMPRRPHSRDVAEYLHGKDKEVLLHLPMQGNGKDPGAGALYRSMSREKILAVLKDDLESVPHIVGVNNHMGSVITADQAIMKLVCGRLKESGLFFIDSLTTNKSVCRGVARDIGLPFNVRDVFLDNEPSSAYIGGQVDKLVRISLRHSEAIGICHPHPETIKALRHEIPRIQELGIEIVPVSAFVR